LYMSFVGTADRVLVVVRLVARVAGGERLGTAVPRSDICVMGNPAG
jgi:hypothetical protein